MYPTLLMTLVAIASYTLWILVVYPHFFEPLRHVPSLKSNWRYRLYQWLYTEPNPREIDDMLERIPHQGLVQYRGIWGTSRLLPLSPDAVKEVLVTKAYGGHFERSPLNRQRFGVLFGEGLFVVEGDTHRTQKKKLLPAFAPRNVKSLHPIFWSKACELADTIEQFMATEAADMGDGYSNVELVSFTSRATLDVIGVAVWGKDFGALRNPHSQFVERYHKIFRGSPKANRQASLIYTAALAVPMRFLQKWFPCEFFDNLRNGSQAIRAACQTAIEEKEKTHGGNSDILSQILSTEAFDDKTLKGHMMNLLAAGHETSSLAATWSCYLLCKRPDVQEKLRHEIRSKLPSRKAVTQDELEALVYLRAVAREALRIIPPAPMVRREASSDTSILSQKVPQGTGVVLSAWHINRNRYEWGSDAAEFRPERWLSLDSKDPSPTTKSVEDVVSSSFAYMPFMAGPRSCIGEGFAKGELLAMLAVLVGRFEMSLVNQDPSYEPDVVWGVTAKPMNLRFKMKALGDW